jgi:hypothetical protein
MPRTNAVWPWCFRVCGISAIEGHRPQGKSGPRAAFSWGMAEAAYFASSLNTSRAAVTVAVMSSSLCAALTKPAS